MSARAGKGQSDANCLFCKIVDKKIPAQMLDEDELSITISDINPQAPTHVLVIPKNHIANITQVEDKELTGYLFHKAGQMAHALGLKRGFRLVINTGDDGGQTVHHLHIHILGGRFMTWPPG